MTSKRPAAVLALLALLTLPATLAACAPPKQAEVADDFTESKEDMASQESGGDQSTSVAAEKDQMREKCCAECKTGMAKDRSGAAPDTIPCADFTDTLSPWCLEHFRSNPIMASKCE